MKREEQQETPLFTALKKYVQDRTISFHVPGHKGGRGIPEFREFVGDNILAIDVTAGILELDNVCNPLGVIKRAEELAADAFGADHAHFLVNGTTSGIQAMILSVAGPGDEIIIPRNAHRSVVGGLILSGARPVYIKPVIDDYLGIAMGITPESVRRALVEHPNAKAVFVINPTYYGVASNLREIVEIAHSFGKPVIVDEAHGAHFAFHPDLPLSAMEAGADMSAASVHKLVGSMTQSSILLVKSRLVDDKRVKAAMNLTQTTSPSYPLMASLDVARKQIALRGREMLDRTIKLCEEARREMNRIEGIYVVGREVEGTEGCFAYDPTKLAINVRELGLSGFEVEKILKYEYHIQVELSDLYNVLAVGAIGDSDESLAALVDAVRDIAQKYGRKNVIKIAASLPENQELVVSPRFAFYSDKKVVPLEESEGEISAEMLMAYPPGIPIICPGERITGEVIEYAKALKAEGCHLQGTEDPEAGFIKVLADRESVEIEYYRGAEQVG
ncbi:aminotransferase class I/II-fold pyridoxal phosphate-dependent enzyme [Thermosediminibacter litoriperuensis]|uniref:Arginine decarboxylase n=1 Tax=Thermosediminibacter litoriperuensis TaxID=291989 RepID=A0A5S5AGY2_9FIRM|nr:aminotransferase class I/II-fold pyridoxal phosphate-dependent enzyme [Thermosediminibacter litoriperuensis]TYP49237.1 arginine decarboxylase [Thermosediminibacter litoriperuensis]